jgi:choline kinase
MKSLTDNRPKGLIELRGKALLDWQLLALQEAGIEETAIITGYKRELFAERGLREFHNPRWAETNMVSSLACAEEWLSKEACIVSYSDIFYGTHAVKLLIESQAALAVTYDPNWLDLWRKRFANPLADAETFRLNADNTLAEIGGKPSSIEEVQGQYMGLLRFMPMAWTEIRRILGGLRSSECDRIHMTGTLQKVIEFGSIPVTAIPYFGEWGEVDSREDLAIYN